MTALNSRKLNAPSQLELPPIGDKKEIDRAIWRRPRGIRLTPTSRYIRDKLFPKSN
jgi:hypothetical protein